MQQQVNCLVTQTHQPVEAKKSRKLFSCCQKNQNRDYRRQNIGMQNYQQKQQFDGIEYTSETQNSAYQQRKSHIQAKKKILVLDLDETLIHTSFKPVSNADFKLDISINNNNNLSEVFTGYVYKRPYLEQFLQKMQQLYEVVIFTASLKQYCDMVMDIFDPFRQMRRLYRQDCVFKNGFYIKDLEMFNTDLRNVIIMDNSSFSFTFHPQNAILCPSFYNEKNDTYLKDIIQYMERLANCEDVRLILKDLIKTEV